MPATIEIYAKPYTLWRYRSLSTILDEHGNSVPRLMNEIGAILNGYIWCSSYSQMNDPMEGIYESISNLGARDVIATIRDRKASLAIASLSETWDNELMWAHYADGFRGICVGYNLTNLLAGFSDQVRLTRMVYADRPRSVTLKPSTNAASRARSVLSTKSARWAYEREWRLFSTSQGPAHYGAGVVGKVLLGSRVDPAHQRFIVESLKGFEDVRVYQTSIHGYSVKRNLIRSSDH